MNAGNTDHEVRPLYEIAVEIREDWGRKISPYAKPYLEAMEDLISIHDRYGMDSANSIVNYFLANARSWQGETARRIKKELKEMTFV